MNKRNIDKLFFTINQNFLNTKLIIYYSFVFHYQTIMKFELVLKDFLNLIKNHKLLIYIENVR